MKPKRRADGSWAFRYYENGTKQGRYLQVILPVETTKTEAGDAYKKALAGASSRTGRGHVPRLTFAALWARYSVIELPKRAPGWRCRVEGIFERLLIPRFGTLHGDALTTSHLVRYRHERELDHVRGDSKKPFVKGATIDKEVSALLALLNFSVEEGLIERNPIAPRALRRERRPPVPQNFFTTEEWDSFVHAFDDEKAWAEHARKVRGFGMVIQRPGRTKPSRKEPISRRFFPRSFGAGPTPKESHLHRERLRASMPLFRWLLVSGSRTGEGIELRWKDVDLARGFVTIYQKKTHRAKTLPLSVEARRLLVAQGRGLPEALVFPRPPGGVHASKKTPTKPVKATPGAWDGTKLWKTFKLALTLAGGRSVLRVHDVRHTAGSWLAQEGFSETVIAEVLGHTRSGVTAGYVHLRPEHLRAAVEKLGDLSQGNARATLGGKMAEPISS